MTKGKGAKNSYIANMTIEERRKAGRVGGIKSGEARRQRKAMKDTLLQLLAIPLEKGKAVPTEKIKNLASVNDLNLSTEQAILFALIQKAMAGDVNAFTAIRNTIGEKPAEKVETSSEVVVINDDI